MKTKFFLITALLAVSLNSLADDPFLEMLKKKLIDPYSKYFAQKRERVYLQVNRSSYLSGDNIWFKAYVYDPANRSSSMETNKLYAELFDNNGKLVERKILFISEGTSNSFFRLNHDSKSGTYTLRAYTNWMRNFNEQTFATQTITVISVGNQTQDQPVVTHATSTTTDVDVQVFPEGGQYVEKADNHFGIKVTLPNGHGSETNCWILNSKNDTIQNFATNKFGIGNFAMYSASKEPYKLGVRLPNGQIKEITLPTPTPTGIAMLVNNLMPQKVLVSLKSNQITVDNLKDKLVHVFIHNNGNIYQSSYAKFNGTETSFSIDRSVLGPGINCITIFNADFKPLAERVIFNNSKSLKGALNIKSVLQNDTLTIEANTLDTAGKAIITDLSFSILPSSTIGNNFNSSLLADVLLSSAVKGTIESPNYYFEEINNAKRLFELDNLLLTQGWRRYEWPDLLIDKVPGIKYEFENGYTIQATAENRFKGKPEKNSQVSLFAPNDNLITSEPVDENGRVSFNNLYLSDSGKVILSASTVKGSSWNRNLKANIVYQKLDSTITINKFNVLSNWISPSNTYIKPLTEKLFELKEVVVRTEKKKDPFEGSIYRSMNDRTYVITKENYNRYTRIEDLLRNEFFLQVTRTGLDELIINMGRGANSFTGNHNPTLIVDGMVMNDLSYLSIIPVQDIEAIAVNKSGNSMLGGLGSNGSISVVTRREVIDFGPDGISSSRQFIVKGYAKPVAFYTPKYVLSPESETYQKYASIYWKPDLKTDSTGKAQFKFAIPKEIKELAIRAEGISVNGTIYYEDKKLIVNQEL
ncbi:hypothetical protein NF867_12105 [Solitalea sp. MAHUQ-68]|uniref:TonB-dependent receptor plug domain-containing protein n=1 Tax=Solitalea agri TaxID=2953739 RepID=A0A9X2F2Q1_9SPHI|nr:hypothetical protein [Solitalea agri]MCO4293609.1 hypothetical protein [Solitalea agri]